MTQPDTLQQHSTLLHTANGTTFRDLNKNGRLDPYEDPRQPIAARIDDLLDRLTLPEKAGLLFINGSKVNPDGALDDNSDAPGFGGNARDMVTDRHMHHINVWAIPAATTLATWHNNLQRHAEQSRLGIPVTLASDPRHHFSNAIFAIAASDFSQWPETLGFGALGDADLVRIFADIVRRDYLAVGIRLALHPQIDLATEPRWARISGGFSEDAHLTAKLGRAYIEGLQGSALGPHSVAAMTKHFPGGGPQNEGLDPHFEFHKGQIYPGDNFDYHLIPFEAAIEAGTAAIMPYYGVPVGQTDDDVAMSFNKAIITGLLREKYGYDGIVCTDWGLITDSIMGDVVYPARAWGVEHLDEASRVLKALDAGVDQFGGESRPDLVIQLVEDGRLPEARLDQSVRRLLRQKFQLGLFDNPFVDETAVAATLGDPSHHLAGATAQKRAMTLLKNIDDTLPLASDSRIYVRNVDPAVAAGYATVVDAPGAADIAILRLETPWYPVDTKNPFALGFHHGDLDFKGEKKGAILALLNAVPTVVVINLDRPAVIPDIAAAARALVADFGASDTAVLDVLFGRARPEGRLPFELPSSMDAVRRQLPDVPYDTGDPLYAFGHGLSYQE